MSERPTPETDAEIILCHRIPDGFDAPEHTYLPSEFARKLERERDEAREERDIAKLELEEISHDLSDARNRIWKLEKQIEGLNNFSNERFDEINKVRKERDEAMKELNEIRAERDLARLSSMESDQMHDRIVGELENVYKERDKLKQVIIVTLEENRHLADGDDCTLAKLKSVVPEWK